MLVFEMLFVRLGIRHRRPTDGAGDFQGGVGGLLLVGGRMTLLLLQLSGLFLGLLLTLDFLMSTGHD